MRKKLLTKETRRDRFERLATLRTKAILRHIKILSNCSNKYVYEYSERDVNKIFNEIEKSLKVAKAKFQSKKDKEFKL